MTSRSPLHALALCAVLGTSNSSVFAQPVSTSFTYQGKLTDNNAPMTGPVDLRFRLFTAADGGTQLGSILTASALITQDGYFTTSLDFGSNFDGNERWLEIAISTAPGSGVFNTLAPRQELTPTPYALTALNLAPTANIGLGTASPYAPLTFGNTLGAKISLFGTSSSSYGMGVQNNKFQFYTDNTNADFIFGVGSSSSLTERMRIKGNGLVGIGTSNPTTALDVVGTGKFTGFQLTGNGAAAGKIMTSDASGLASWTTPASATWSLSGTNVFYNAGNVGLGTSSPATKLHVLGTGRFTGLLEAQDELVVTGGGVRSGGSATTTSDFGIYDLNAGFPLRVVSSAASIDFYTNATNGTALAPPANSASMSIRSTGSVGIGITSPQAKLHVDGSMRLSSGAQQVNFTFGGAADIKVPASDLYINASGGRGMLLLQTDAGATNVGIGTSNPTEKLHVAGNVRCNVLVIDGGSDLAESYNVAPTDSIDALPGMVVSIDPDRVGALRLSDAPYDRAVAGIISGANGIAPGMILNQKGSIADGQFPVTNVGRVWCYVDADAGGAVHAGDLLTTAPTPGHAMKVTQHDRANGAVIGKAMSSLESGRGLVLVLVSLQ